MSMQWEKESENCKDLLTVLVASSWCWSWFISSHFCSSSCSRWHSSCAALPSEPASNSLTSDTKCARNCLFLKQSMATLIPATGDTKGMKKKTYGASHIDSTFYLVYWNENNHTHGTADSYSLIKTFTNWMVSVLVTLQTCKWKVPKLSLSQVTCYSSWG